MPSKKEIKLLKYLNKIETRFDNNKRGDFEKNIKNKLEITNDDIGDMHYSNYLLFGSVNISSINKNGANQVNQESIICITHEGSCFIKNYNYSKFKETFYWIFGVSSIIAAIFAILAVFKK